MERMGDQGPPTRRDVVASAMAATGALLAGNSAWAQAARSPGRIDLHHHYCSPDWLAALTQHHKTDPFPGLETITGQGFVFDGTHHQSYLVNYTRKPDCPAHDADLPVETLP